MLRYYGPPLSPDYGKIGAALPNSPCFPSTLTPEENWTSQLATRAGNCYMADNEPLRGSPDDIPNVVAWGWDFVMYPGDWGIKCDTSVELTKWEFRPYEPIIPPPTYAELQRDYLIARDAVRTLQEVLAAANRRIADLTGAKPPQAEAVEAFDTSASFFKYAPPHRKSHYFRPPPWMRDNDTQRAATRAAEIKGRLAGTGVFEYSLVQGDMLLITPESCRLIWGRYGGYAPTVFTLFNMEVVG